MAGNNKKPIEWEVNENGCMLVTSHQPHHKNGYIKVRRTIDGKYGSGWKDWQLHRLVWTQRYGEIPKGMIIMHTCDNRTCINIEHLKLGTQKDNMLDKKVKGRCYNGKGDRPF